MEEIRLTSRYGKYPILYRVLYIPGGAGFLPSTVSKRYTPVKIYICHETWWLEDEIRFSKPKQTMGMVYLSTFTIKISQMWANIPNMGNGPFQGRHSLNFRGPVSRIMLAPDNLRSRLWPRSFPRHHRSIPLPVNRGLGGSFNGNFQGVFNHFLSFFGAKLQIWGVYFFWGGLESYMMEHQWDAGWFWGCLEIQQISSLDLHGLAPQKNLAVWWLFEGFTVIFSVCYFSSFF